MYARKTKMLTAQTNHSPRKEKRLGTEGLHLAR
jgi:hypothetical protein